MIPDAALDLLAAALRGEADDLQIRYVALGAGDTPPGPADVALADERFRKAYSRQGPLGVGGTQTVVFVAPHEAVFPIREIGFFGGPGATEDPDTGVLIGRFLYSRDKTALESLQITEDDLIGRAGP